MESQKIGFLKILNLGLNFMFNKVIVLQIINKSPSKLSLRPTYFWWPISFKEIYKLEIINNGIDNIRNFLKIILLFKW